MRLLTALTALTLPLLTLAAPKDRFARQYAKSLPLTITDDTFASLTKTPRDYSIAVLLTAQDPRFGCKACQDFQPEWDILGRSWQKGDKKGESRLLTGTLDFDQGKATFQDLGLQHAPVLMLYPRTVGVGSGDAEPVRFDFTAGTQSAEAVHAWLSRHLPEGGPRPPVVRPFNYVKAVIVTTALLGLVTFFTVAAPYVWPVMQNRNLWAAVSLIAVLLFTSGQMFNHIRHTAYAGGDGKGGVSVFAGGFQNQYGLETQVVAGICE